MQMKGIANTADIDRIEVKGLPDDLPSSTYEMILRGSEINPDGPALSFFLSSADHKNPEQWSYRVLMEKLNQSANFFRDLGVNRPDTVAFVLPNLPETHLTIWGGQTAGRVASFNPLLESEALGELIAASNAKVLVTLAPFPGVDIWQKLSPVLGKLKNLEHIVLVRLSDHVAGVKKGIARLMEAKMALQLHGWRGVESQLPKGVKLHDFYKSIAKFPSKSLLFKDLPTAHDISSCFCTGGTTGLPKIALRTHQNEVFNAWSAGQFLGDGFSSRKNLLCGLPLFHVNAVLVTGLLPFSQGAHVILATPQGYRGPGLLQKFWEIVEHHQVHSFSGVPTLYSALLDVPINQHNVSSLEYALCGAAPMPKEVMKQFQERTGVKILEGYGLTEGTCVSSVNPPLGEQRLGSIGVRIPFQAMKTVVLDDTGQFVRDCDLNEVGQILISGPNVFQGYSLDSQNKGLWIDCGDNRRWLNTGDLGRMDAQGYFYLTGRKKELIIRGGHNIDPKMIEDAMHQHPAVQMAAAIGRLDSHAGELPVVYVQLKTGAGAEHRCGEQSLMEFAQAHIPERAALPKFVRIVSDLPLTGVGKIFKPELKRRETLDSIQTLLKEHGLHTSSLDVYEDKNRGLCVRVNLAPGEDEAKLKSVIGKLAIHLELERESSMA